MKTLLIRPPPVHNTLGKLISSEVPLGLAYIAAYLEEKGQEVEIIDLMLSPNPVKDLNNKIKRFQPELFGLTAFTVEICNAHKIAELIKKSSTNPIVIGGLHASALPIETLNEFQSFDISVFGEGEIPMLNIISSLESDADLSSIKGVCYREKSGQIKKNSPQSLIENLDTLPFPARHKIKIYEYRPLMENYKRLPTTGVSTSRGCPYNCTFCSKSVYGISYRYRSAENVVEELKECINRYKIRDFKFYDECLTVPRKRMISFCRSILKERLDITWNCYSRVDTIDKELLRIMKRAGCYHVKYGVESGTKRVLKLINKRINLKQAYSTIRMTSEVGLSSKVSFMLGQPSETAEEVEKTIEFAKILSPDYVTFSVTKPFPGTKIFNDAMENNDLIHTDWQLYGLDSAPILKNQIKSEILQNYIIKAYREFYLRPKYFLKRLKRLIENPTLLEIKNNIRGLLVILRSEVVKQMFSKRGK